MAKRKELVMDIFMAKCLKEESEEGLKKVDEGIKWGTYSLLAMIAEVALMACATFLESFNLVFEVLSVIPMLAHFVFMIMAIVKGGGVMRVVKTMLRIAKWAYFLIPFPLFDFIIALYVGLGGVGAFFSIPVVFYLIMKRSYKKDLDMANAYIRLYEE